MDVSGVPVWEVHDNSEVVQGSVKGRAVTKVARKRESWDGGFGSVDSVLYLAYEAKGGPCLTTPTCCQIHFFSQACAVHLSGTRISLCHARHRHDTLRQCRQGILHADGAMCSAWDGFLQDGWRSALT